jgi:hypothetical protein
MPTTGARAARANNSMSPTMVRPRARGVEERSGQRHPRGDHDQVGMLEQRGIEAAGAQHHVAAERAERAQPRRFRAAVGHRDPRAAREQEARDRVAGLAKTDDHGAQRHGRGCAHRSFSVDRPASTSRKLMIQKRTITFGSAQPLSSK